MKKAVLNTFNRLAAAESAFVGGEFLAPVVRGRGVTVQIAGVRCTLSVSPNDFEGWGVFRAASHSDAVLVREASATERRRYLRLLPSNRLIACLVDQAQMQATPANLADDRFRFTGPIAVQLWRQVQLFDTLLTRFDGSQFWFDEIDPRADPSMAAFLRRELTRMSDPNEIMRAGLTMGQRLAYALEFTRRANAILADRQRQADVRLKLALTHAGAILCDFCDAPDAYRVTFTVDGRRHTSVVRKDDLTVQSAGICLSGEDQKFDLSSLVGVLREGAVAGRFVRY